MAQSVKILFVDDEPAIRASLPAILQLHGFDVTCAASVGEAVHELAAKPFDVLISDLNIGSPGDGFTVVSAMRRTQPNCVTLILTGYPAFETALQAIRSQVDDYLIKPAGVQELVDSIETKLRNRTPRQLARPKTLAQILRDNARKIADQILDEQRRVLLIPRPSLAEDERRSLIEVFVRYLADQMSSGNSLLTSEVIEWSRTHGRLRHQQGFTAAMLVEENRIACSAILDCIHDNLLVADVSRLIPDMKVLSGTLSAMLREAIAGHAALARAA